MQNSQSKSQAAATTARELFLSALCSSVLSKITPYLNARGGINRIAAKPAAAQDALEALADMTSTASLSADWACFVGDKKSTELYFVFSYQGPMFPKWGFNRIHFTVRKAKDRYKCSTSVEFLDELNRPTARDEGWVHYASAIKSEPISG